MKLVNEFIENYLFDTGMSAKDFDFKIGKKWKVRAFSPLWIAEIIGVAVLSFVMIWIISILGTAITSL